MKGGVSVVRIAILVGGILLLAFVAWQFFVGPLLGLRRSPMGVALLSAVAEARKRSSAELFSLAKTSRDYGDIARKNIFTGAPPPVTIKDTSERPDAVDVRRFIFLNQITGTALRNEAFLGS